MSRLKAYKVLETCEDTGGIVFAKCCAEARRKGAGIWGDGDWFGVACNRAPEFDEYAAQGRVPILALYRNGWWHHCPNCERRISTDSWDDEDPKSQKEPREYKGDLYCDQWCVLAFAELRAESAQRKRLAMNWARTVLPTGCEVTNGHYTTEYLEKGRSKVIFVADFTFPGAQGLGQWRSDGKSTVQARDLDAWTAFGGKIRAS